MITNKYWKVEKWWNYWIELQMKNGIKPRKKDFKPSSAFEVLLPFILPSYLFSSYSDTTGTTPAFDLSSIISNGPNRSIIY